MSLLALRGWLKNLPSGPVGNVPEVEAFLAEAWSSLACRSDDHRTYPGKLYGRTEELNWQPPLLRFVLERHGATVRGSTRAELHHWVVDVEAGTRFVEKVGRRQLRTMAKRLDVSSIGERIAGVILREGEDSAIRWSPDKRKVSIVMKELVGTGFARTLTGRRKRIQAVIEPLLRKGGWVPGTMRGRFSRP